MLYAGMGTSLWSGHIVSLTPISVLQQVSFASTSSLPQSIMAPGGKLPHHHVTRVAHYNTLQHLIQMNGNTANTVRTVP